VPEASDYIATLPRPDTSYHRVVRKTSSASPGLRTVLRLKEVCHAPSVTNFVIPKALERANAEQLSYTGQPPLPLIFRRQSPLMLIAHHCSETRIGILRALALIECAASPATLNTLQDEIYEVSLYHILHVVVRRYCSRQESICSAFLHFRWARKRIESQSSPFCTLP
jgi:hypothetical protein